MGMRAVFNQLCKELGEKWGQQVFEWYCKTYNVTIADKAPASVKREVLGL